MALVLAELVLQLARPAPLDAIRARTFHVASEDADFITLQPLNFDPGTGQALMVFDPALFWRMTPGREGTFFLTDDVRTNALGLRGPPLPAAREQGELRLLVLGDSVTFGFRVAERERWSERLAQRLRQQLPGRPVVPVNAGVVGYTSSQGRAALPALLHAVRPDIVLACFGINDCIAYDASDATLAAVIRSAPERLHRALRASQLVCALEGGWALARRELHALATGRRRPVAHWLHYPEVPRTSDKVPRSSEAEYLGNLAAMRSTCREAGVPLVLVTELASPAVPSNRPFEAALFERIEARFAALRAWAAAQDVPIADVVAEVRASGLAEAELLLDPFHPSPAGHERIAAAAERALREAGLVEGRERR